MHLCGFHLLKEQEVVMTEWQVHISGQPLIHEEGYLVIDQDPLTYISDKYFTVSYYFDKPVVISEFMIQARNDDNNVKPGCVYELMYWDGGWRSAGSKQATDTLLVFENIPSGALYWLRNHTEGIQEQVFLLDERGYQYWPGVSSFKDSYHEFFELESFCPD